MGRVDAGAQAVGTEPGGLLGLDRAVRRLVAEDGFEDRYAALRAVAEYERFFLLAARGGAGTLVPSRRIDLVWRRHMLDTRAYADDCARWAGVFLHRDEGTPEGAYERTLELMNPSDLEAWDEPGLARISAGSEGSGLAVEPRGDLDREDFSAVLARVRASLREMPAPWVADAIHVVESEPASAVEEYRRFLRMAAEGPGRVTPSKLVDEFWHQHILDSRAYARFCARVAGRFLHHAPSYEKPHGFHEPAFRRTLELYRARNGTEPPPRIWGHMGESGGGDGGSCSSSPPPPLYAVDTPREMRAVVRYGKVDPRFARPMHPVLVEKGLPEELWAGLLRDVQAAPKMSWAEFSAIPRNTPRLWAGCWLGAVVGFQVAALAMNAVEPRVARHPTPPLWLVAWELSFGLMAFASAAVAGLAPMVYLAKWAGRPYDAKRIGATLSDYAWRFDAYGVGLGCWPDTGQALVVDASLTDDEMHRKLDEAARNLDAGRLERERAEREKEEARRWKRALRDAYYLERGVKPGPTAWFRILPDWVQAILLGLAGGLSLVLAALILRTFVRAIAG